MTLYKNRSQEVTESHEKEEELKCILKELLQKQVLN